jgi:hypothetical protein
MITQQLELSLSGWMIAHKEKTWKEAVMAISDVSSRYLSHENHKIPQSGEPISRSRFEIGLRNTK